MTKLKLKPRKIVSVGNSSFISLPIEWLYARDIKKGDSLNLEITEEHELLISVGGKND